MTHGSLFTGIGGFDLGFESVGITTAWQVEIDPFCQALLKTHWPNVPKREDINNCGRHNLARVDIIAGGFPCQDLSVAGHRAGLSAPRSGLFYEFARVVSEMRPRWFVCENVPGLLSSNKGKDFQAVIETLSQCGYCVAWRVLDSRYFGVAQRRRRVFIVGSLGNGSAAEILFECKSSTRDIEEGSKARAGTPESVARSIITSTCWKRHDTDTDTLVPCIKYDSKASGVDKPTLAVGGSGTHVVAQPIRSNPYNNSDAGMEARGFIGVLQRSDSESKRGDLPHASYKEDSGGSARRSIASDAGEAIDPNRVLPASGFSERLDDTKLRMLAESQEVNDANEDEANARKVLRELQCSVPQEAFRKWGTRILVSFPSAQVLQSEMLWGSRKRPTQGGSWLHDGTLSCPPFVCEGAMREMWEAECLRRTPQGWRLAQQLRWQLGAYLSGLPHEATRYFEDWRYGELGQERDKKFRYPLLPIGMDSARYRALGNAVTTTVAAWIGRRIVEVGMRKI